MKKVIAYELTKELLNICRENKMIKTFISDNNIETYDFGIVVSAENSIDITKNLFIEAGVFEVEYSLFKLVAPNIKQVFTDFGFISHKNNHYLYEELVIPFSVNSHDKKDLSSGLEQMDEHLIAIDHSDADTIYLVERYHQQLIEGIAKAYNINVTFFL